MIGWIKRRSGRAISLDQVNTASMQAEITRLTIELDQVKHAMDEVRRDNERMNKALSILGQSPVWLLVKDVEAALRGE